jgi:hypothetical protein
MVFMDVIAVYCENHTKHVNTLRRQNVKAGGAYSYHFTQRVKKGGRKFFVAIV